jgi:hypothetical protein
VAVHNGRLVGNSYLGIASGSRTAELTLNLLIHAAFINNVGLRWGSRMRRRLPDLPASDQQPKHEDQLPKERDKEESNMGVRIKVWLKAIDYPTQSIDYQ